MLRGLPDFSPQQIETVIQRFEAAVEQNGLPTPYRFRGGRHCGICHAERRKEINRRILEGMSRPQIAKEFAVLSEHVTYHFRQHLLPVMGQEITTGLLDVVSRLEVMKRFPINASERKQTRWYIGQLMVARKLLLDEIDNPGGMEKFNRGALMDFVRVIREIRDTAMLMHQAKNGGKRSKDDDLDGDLTEEQKKTLAEAKEKRAQAKKLIEVQSNEQKVG